MMTDEGYSFTAKRGGTTSTRDDTKSFYGGTCSFIAKKWEEGDKSRKGEKRRKHRCTLNVTEPVLTKKLPKLDGVSWIELAGCGDKLIVAVIY